jgi:hypothetical protein
VFGALRNLSEIAFQAFQIHQSENSKRERLRTYRETEVARIAASEQLLHSYFDRIFAERKKANEQLFNGLRQAVEKGDLNGMQTIVGGIIEIARTSPLTNIGDLAELRNAMADPNTTFDL